MEDDRFSWKLAFSYLLVIAMSALLLAQGQPPGLAAMPCFLLWMMLNRKWPMD
jgi:hypothetical protein